MKMILIPVFIFVFTSNLMAQTNETKAANPADVASIEAIIKAVYDVISGDANQKRDWARFRTLFHKDARMIPIGMNPNTKIVSANALTPEDYIKRVEPIFAKQGFYEREKARRIEIYGNIAHVFSTYESFYSLSDKSAFVRGINSFQLLNDGRRWWVVTIFWQNETPENPIPKKYLEN